MDHDRPVHKHALPLRIAPRSLQPPKPDEFDRSYSLLVGSSDAFHEPPVYGSGNGLNCSHHGGDFASSDFGDTQSTHHTSLFSNSLCEGTQDSDYPQEDALSSQTLNFGNVSHTQGSGGIHDLCDVNAGWEPPSDQGAGVFCTDQSVAAIGRQFQGHSEGPRFSAPYGFASQSLSHSYAVPFRDPLQHLGSQLSVLDPLLRPSDTVQGMAHGNTYHSPDHSFGTEESSLPLDDQLGNIHIQQDIVRGSFYPPSDAAPFVRQPLPAYPYSAGPQNPVQQFNARPANISTEQYMDYDGSHRPPGNLPAYCNYQELWQAGLQRGERSGAQPTHLSGPADAPSSYAGPPPATASPSLQDIPTSETSHLNWAQRPFFCIDCRLGFETSKTLRRHLTKVPPHVNVFFTCKCGYKPPRKDNLERHFKICRKLHDTSAVFICICSSEFPIVEDFKRHMRGDCSEQKKPGRPPN